jgi:hypothetical protein
MAGAERRRAYIVVGGIDSSHVAANIDAVTVIPAGDDPNIVALRQDHRLDTAAYYRQMALHASIRTILYWLGEDDARVSLITFDHMLTTPGNWH